MKLPEAIRKCVSEQNAEMAGKIAETLSFRGGFTYYKVHAFVSKYALISLTDWEALLYESESL